MDAVYQNIVRKVHNLKRKKFTLRICENEHLIGEKIIRYLIDKRIYEGKFNPEILVKFFSELPENTTLVFSEETDENFRYTIKTSYNAFFDKVFCVDICHC